MAKMYGKGKTAIESEEQQRLRWQVELEFVQCLANPNYLNFLAQRGYFKDQTFVNYIKYLQYWKDPEYAKFIMYPMSLYFLDLLQFEHFRREIVSAQCCKFIDEQAILQWQHYARKRVRMLNSVQASNTEAEPPTSSTGSGVTGATGSTAAGTSGGTNEATTVEQIQPGTQKVNPSASCGSLQNGANTGGQTAGSGSAAATTQGQSQPSAQLQSSQQQQIGGGGVGATSQQQMNGLPGSSSSGTLASNI